MDLHPTYVGGIERGERNVSSENVCRLANAFNLTLSQFFDFPKTGRGKRDVTRARIISLLRHRSEEDLALFSDIIGAVNKRKSQTKRFRASQRHANSIRPQAGRGLLLVLPPDHRAAADASHCLSHRGTIASS